MELLWHDNLNSPKENQIQTITLRKKTRVRFKCLHTRESDLKGKKGKEIYLFNLYLCWLSTEGITKEITKVLSRQTAFEFEICLKSFNRYKIAEFTQHGFELKTLTIEKIIIIVLFWKKPLPLWKSRNIENIPYALKIALDFQEYLARSWRALS